MKNKSKVLLPFLLGLLITTSCINDNNDPVDPEPQVSYILNYGDYVGAKSTITAFDKETGTYTNDYFRSMNTVPMISNVQHAVNHNGKIYFMGNSLDQIFWVDAKTFGQTENGITTNIVKPRFGAALGNYLYVSCWGGDIWADETTSYIAKVNLTSKTVEKKIALPGGPEGMEIVNNKLYAALNYRDSVAVVDLSNDAVSYIATPAVTSYFLKDKSNNLYVSLISTYSDYSESTGLGYINTATNQLESVYHLDGVSYSYVNILSANTDFTKIYVMTSAYDEFWNLTGAVAAFDVAGKTFSDDYIVENVSGLNGIAYFNDHLFCFEAESVTGNGTAKIYLPDGTPDGEFQTGIYPFMLFTADE